MHAAHRTGWPPANKNCAGYAATSRSALGAMRIINCQRKNKGRAHREKLLSDLPARFAHFRAECVSKRSSLFSILSTFVARRESFIYQRQFNANRESENSPRHLL